MRYKYLTLIIVTDLFKKQYFIASFQNNNNNNTKYSTNSHSNFSICNTSTEYVTLFTPPLHLQQLIQCTLIQLHAEFLFLFLFLFFLKKILKSKKEIIVLYVI